MKNLVAAVYLKCLVRSETKRWNVIADQLLEQSAHKNTMFGWDRVALINGLYIANYMQFN